VETALIVDALVVEESAPVEPTPVLSEPALVEQVVDLAVALKKLVDGLHSGDTEQDQDLSEQLSGVVAKLKELVDGLLGGGTQQDQDLSEQLSGVVAKLKELVDGLLGGGTQQDQDLSEQLSGVIAKLKELVDGLLDGLLDGGETPNPGNMSTSTAALQNLATALMRLVEVLHHSFFEQASNSSFGQVSNLPEQINSALVDIQPPISFSSFSAEGIPTPTEQTPTEQNQMPVHQMPVQAPVPSPTPPVSSYLAGSGTLASGDAPVLLLLGALASLAILMLGGRFSWPSYAILKPLSAVQLPIERPG